MLKQSMSLVLTAFLWAAPVAADDKVIAWWSSILHHEILDGTPGIVQVADYGVTDLMLAAYNMPLTVGASHLSAIKRMSDLAPPGVRLWIMVHWAGGCNCSTNKCGHPDYDHYAGTIRQYIDDTGDVFRPFVDGDGITYAAAPCPTWNGYWAWQTERVRNLSRLCAILPNVVGIIWDAELYLSNRCTTGPHIARYNDLCHCGHCRKVGLENQRGQVRQLALRVRGATSLRLGIANGDGLISGSERPVPYYSAIHEAWQPTYQFSEQFYSRGFSDSDGRGGSVINFGTWESIWTDGGQWDVRFVPGLNVDRLFAADRDRRYIGSLDGVLASFRWQLWGLHEYADGFFIYWFPYRVPAAQDFCPDLCCCKNRDCGPFTVDQSTFLEAIAQVNDPPPNPCDYSVLPNGMYEVETVRLDDGEIIRRMVAQNTPCYPPQVRGNTQRSR